MKPTAKLLDPKWKYTPALYSDIRKTFVRVRAEMAKQRRRK